MARSVSLFSGYEQKENRTTNYCLLILKLLYDEDPRLLATALGRLLEDDEWSSKVGVRFQQQTRKGGSIPDGIIFQPAFSIFIEAKTTDWFYDAQLRAHLQALGSEGAGQKLLIALSQFEGDRETRFESLEAWMAEEMPEVDFAAVTYEEFLDAVEMGDERLLPAQLEDTITDFREYVSEQGLLPTWRRTLDVVSCNKWPDDVLKHGVYMCPATGGSYSHKRALYFGMYRNKCVERVARIDAVVDVSGPDDARLRWKNGSRSKKHYIEEAIETVMRLRPDALPVRTFVLGELHETDFRKDSKHGLWGKRYFDIGDVEAETAAELASALRGKVWSEVQQG